MSEDEMTDRLNEEEKDQDEEDDLPFSLNYGKDEDEEDEELINLNSGRDEILVKE